MPKKLHILDESKRAPVNGDVKPLTRDELHAIRNEYGAERILYRPANRRLRAKLYLPYVPGGSRKVLARELGCLPEWTDKLWQIARNHFRKAATRLLKPGDVVVLESVSYSKCDRRCWEAIGDECQCSCFGRFHGGLDYVAAEMKEVGSTTLVTQDSVQRIVFVVAPAGELAA